MFERYSALARTAVFVARKEAGRTGATSIDTEHLLIGILTVHSELRNQLSIEIDLASIRNRSGQSQVSNTPIPDTVDLPITSELGKLLKQAISVADLWQCREIRTEHLVASMLEEGGQAAMILADSQLDKKAMSDLISGIDCSKPQQLTEASRRAMSSILNE